MPAFSWLNQGILTYSKIGNRHYTISDHFHDDFTDVVQQVCHAFKVGVDWDRDRVRFRANEEAKIVFSWEELLPPFEPISEDYWREEIEEDGS